MKDCIHDFIEAWKKYDQDVDINPKVPPWTMRLHDAGYFGVDKGSGSWRECHEWCREQIGHRHYAWVGNRFWFECEQHAVLFKLKWG